MPAAIWLGAAGLLPFLALSCTALVMAGDGRAVALVLLAQYGALIVTFVGALHWGYAVERGLRGRDAWLRCGFSVLPALWAWVALQFSPAVSLQMLAAALAVCLVADILMRSGRSLPAWFIRLRIVLTAVGASSLLAGSLA